MLVADDAEDVIGLQAGDVYKRQVLAQSVSESAAATMAQLAKALLPFGWTLDWQAPDWLVPGGFFSLDNQTPIEAIKYLAEAAGGFVLPHQRDRHLIIKPRYPTVPWQLDGALADVAIPRAIICLLYTSRCV